MRGSCWRIFLCRGGCGWGSGWLPCRGFCGRFFMCTGCTRGLWRDRLRRCGLDFEGNCRGGGGWATAGAVVWASVAVLARVGVARIGVIELVFLFAPLVIVPLGMEVGRVSGTALLPVSRRLGEWAQVLQPLGAALAVFAMLLPTGTWAGVAASGWLVVCGAAAAGGMVELKQ